MKFSIITVCYNAENEIAQTIDSVISQTCTDYEYIVIDGGSCDRTIEIVKSKKVTYVSEPDNGIYDAMNKGVSLSTGEYILFLNAGDSFVDNSVLQKVSECIKGDIAYGDAVLCNGKLFKYHEAEELDNVLFHLPFCHQCVFTKRNLFDIRKYNTAFSVLADYEFYLFFYLQNAEFQHMKLLVAVYKNGGYSSRNRRKSENERIEIYKVYSIPYMNARKASLKELLRKIIPPKIYRMHINRRLIELGYKEDLGEAIDDYRKTKNQD